MSRLTELISQVAKADPALADDLRREVEVLGSRRPFGLNFEKHVPESIQLPNRRIRRGDKVVFRDADTSDRRPWLVVGFEGEGASRKVQLARRVQNDEENRRIAGMEDLVVVAEFRDQIYPGLRSTGVVERGEDKPFHAVINGENYHVLQALSFVCRGEVDCIYIDPPYNTRDKDWKYNNDYVDADDRYKHSKWLAMMERRLVLSKELLNPEDSALIVTIDENEYLRLGLLLEQLFPEATIQMVTSVVSAKGAVRPGRFSRVEEYIFYVLLGRARIRPWVKNMLTTYADEESWMSVDGERTAAAMGACDQSPQPLEWLGLRRREPSSLRGSRKNQFFAIFVDRDTGAIHSIGDAIEDTTVDRRTVGAPLGTVALWPLKPDETEMIWGLTPDAVRNNLSGGYVRVNAWKPDKLTGTVQYLPGGSIAKISKGSAVITGRRADGSVEVQLAPGVDASVPPKRVWHVRSHNAETGGTKMLSALIPKRRFEYPKSLYAVEDALRFVIGDKRDALVLDFFAGTGTTSHAVARLNKQDDGWRRSICVTNNEVAADEAERLKTEGLRPGDPGWEACGVCEHITKPRIRAAISGKTPEGALINGSYKYADEFLMAEGLAENVEFFDLTYEDPERVQHGLDFEAIAPLLWFRAGSEGRRIKSVEEPFAVADAYAILFNLDAAAAFIAAVRAKAMLCAAYVVTDDETQFQVVARQLPQGVDAIRLYAAYLDNFRAQVGA
jgi:adenine-specific DNA-methyltransferase